MHRIYASMNTVERVDVFEDTDVYINQNLISFKGFSANIPLEKMVELAVLNDCNILVKAGKWYLKKGLHTPTVNFLKFNQEKGYYKGVTTYVIMYKQL